MTKRQAGLTLLEMLVALLIAAMATTLLAQAMRQLAGVERLLERSGYQGQVLTVRREALRQLLRAALPEQLNEPVQFEGDAANLRWRSAQAGDWGVSPLQNQILRIERDPRTQASRLMLTTEDKPKEGLEVLAWSGANGGFSYLDAAGAWHSKWPANSSPESVRRVPRMVRIEMGSEVGGDLVAAVVSTESARVRLKDWVD